MSDQEQEREDDTKEEEEHDASLDLLKRCRKGAGKRLNDKQRVEIIQIAENSKISKRQLAERFGVSEAAIRKLLLQKDDVLKRYYETPEEIRDQRLRGSSYHKEVNLGSVSLTALLAGPTTPTPAARPAAATGGPAPVPQFQTMKSVYPPDDPWKLGLLTLVNKITPFLRNFTLGKRAVQITTAEEFAPILASSVAVPRVLSVGEMNDESSDEDDEEEAPPGETTSGKARRQKDPPTDWFGFARLLRDVRRAFHRYPETGYQEVNAQAFIKKFCEQGLNIPGKNIREMALTGLVVDVYHRNGTVPPADKRKLPVIAFRADMDALPIEELNENLPYCSTQKKGTKELRKRKKRRCSTPSSSSKAANKATTFGSNAAASDMAIDEPPATNLLPASATITTQTIGAPPAGDGDDDDNEFQETTAAAHMCGHDGHMVMVLGLCAMVVRNAHMLPEDTFVRFVFQPAEEGPGGAMKMIEDGALTDVDEIYGLHNAPFPLYSIHVRPGAVMAHEVEFSIDIHGIGGHGSAPQQCVDPILAGSAVVQALQSVVSRSLSPTDTAVVSVTQFRGGDANNVIPSRVHLGGTIRDFDLQVAEKIKDRVAKLVHSTCAAYGATATVHFLDGYAPVINPHVETRQVQQIALDMGMYTSEDGLPLMAAEDFSYFLQERKGCYFFLGTKEEGDHEETRALHSNHFDFNDKAIPLGIRMFVGILQSRFNCPLYTPEDLQAFQIAMERLMLNVTVV
ncbi:hypothetical protein PRIC1_002115 [Phytophthora ramorum]|uniref:Peptidase M20 dimerisation domain-containing protein n=1 Tax=Phytophthora ramorum TaxID=164328 RepID=H3GSH6_PHYRM|nr:Thermostable carboxypeptidase 2 [Phytophthora ramorum]